MTKQDLINQKISHERIEDYLNDFDNHDCHSDFGEGGCEVCETYFDLCNLKVVK